MGDNGWINRWMVDRWMILDGWMILPLGAVVRACNPSCPEAEACGSLDLRGSELHRAIALWIWRRCSTVSLGAFCGGSPGEWCPRLPVNGCPVPVCSKSDFFLVHVGLRQDWSPVLFIFFMDRMCR